VLVVASGGWRALLFGSREWLEAAYLLVRRAFNGGG